MTELDRIDFTAARPQSSLLGFGDVLEYFAKRGGGDEPEPSGPEPFIASISPDPVTAWAWPAVRTLVLTGRNLDQLQSPDNFEFNGNVVGAGGTITAQSATSLTIDLNDSFFATPPSATVRLSIPNTGDPSLGPTFWSNTYILGYVTA
jgi:hypothetical protein